MAVKLYFVSLVAFKAAVINERAAFYSLRTLGQQEEIPNPLRHALGA